MLSLVILVIGTYLFFRIDPSNGLIICGDWWMHRGAFVTLASPHIKTVSLETIVYWRYVTAPTSICISVLSVQQVKYSALNTSYSFQLKEAFNLLRSDILSCTFKLIVSYWTNFFSCYELQTLRFGHWPQQFRARHSSYWQKRINTWNVIIFCVTTIHLIVPLTWSWFVK